MPSAPSLPGWGCVACRGAGEPRRSGRGLPAEGRLGRKFPRCSPAGAGRPEAAGCSSVLRPRADGGRVSPAGAADGGTLSKGGAALSHRLCSRAQAWPPGLRCPPGDTPWAPVRLPLRGQGQAGSSEGKLGLHAWWPSRLPACARLTPELVCHRAPWLLPQHPLMALHPLPRSPPPAWAAPIGLAVRRLLVPIPLGPTHYRIDLDLLPLN